MFHRKSNRFIASISVAFLFLTLLACGQTNKLNQPGISKLLQSKLDSLTEKQVVPGVTLSVRFNDGTNISLASGMADVENHIPMTPDAVK